jgi:hypothetical protein
MKLPKTYITTFDTNEDGTRVDVIAYYHYFEPDEEGDYGTYRIIMIERDGKRYLEADFETLKQETDLLYREIETLIEEQEGIIS